MKTITLIASLLFVAGIARATVTETFKQTYPLTADGVVQLENVNGAVEITAWDKSEVALEAEKSAPDDEYLKRIHIVIEAASDRLSIKTQYEKKWSFSGNDRGEVHYKLKVPAGVSLKKIAVVNSDITVRGVTGAVELETVNGGISAAGLAGAGHFNTVNGSIAVEYTKLAASGKIVLDTVNGSCRISVPKTAAFEFVADSVNGGISCDLPITLEKSGRHHLRGTVGGGGPQISMDSVNGSLTVKAN
jgi:hypothetical protein